MAQTIYVTLGSITFELEGTYHKGVAATRETPPEPEHFEIDRVFCDLKVQGKDDEVTVDITELATECDLFDLIDEKANGDLSQFNEPPEY